MTLTYEPLKRLLAESVDARIEAACMIYLKALGTRTISSAIAALREQDLIDEATASHLALGLMGDLTVSKEQIAALQPPAPAGLSLPASIPPAADGTDPRGSAAVGAIPRDCPPDPPSPDVGAHPRALRGPPSAAPAQVAASQAGSHVCPICGVRISTQATACREHWRQIKQEAADEG